MASVTNKGIPTEYAFFGDYFNYRKKFYFPEQSDDYWTAVINEADELIRKYDCNDYLRALVLVCVDDLERRYRQEFPEQRIYRTGEVTTTVYKRIMRKHEKEGEQ